MGMLALVALAAAADRAAETVADAGPAVERGPDAAIALIEPAPRRLDPVAWAGTPVAVDLHPVVFDYGHRYQSLLASGMGGPKASPVFGPVVAEADLHWRLLAETGEGLPMDAETADRWRDAAVAGAVVAFEGLLDETFRRAPQLRVLQVAADTVINPTVEIKRRDGHVAVDHPTGAAKRDLERAEAELDMLPVRHPNASVRTGLDWKMKAADAPDDEPLLAWTAYVTATETAVTSMRADVALSDLQWSVYARERVYPKVYLTASARSVDVQRPRGAPLEVPEPGKVAAGVLWAIPWQPGWSVKLERIAGLQDDSTTWMVTLRGENRTPIPARLQPPLGEVETGGLALPDLPDREPNAVAAWRPPPPPPPPPKAAPAKKAVAKKSAKKTTQPATR